MSIVSTTPTTFVLHRLPGKTRETRGEELLLMCVDPYMPSISEGFDRKHLIKKLAELQRIQLEGSDRLVGVKTLGKISVTSINQVLYVFVNDNDNL